MRKCNDKELDIKQINKLINQHHNDLTNVKQNNRLLREDIIELKDAVFKNDTNKEARELVRVFRIKMTVLTEVTHRFRKDKRFADIMSGLAWADQYPDTWWANKDLLTLDQLKTSLLKAHKEHTDKDKRESVIENQMKIV